MDWARRRALSCLSPDTREFAGPVHAEADD